MSDLTPERIADLRKWHAPMGRVTQSGAVANHDICKDDGEVMPCVVLETLDALAAAEAALAAERERNQPLRDRIKALQDQHDQDTRALKKSLGRYQTIWEEAERRLVENRDGCRWHPSEYQKAVYGILEARAEQAERERDASVKARMDWQRDYDREKRQHHARLDALRERAEQAERAAGRLVADCARVREECDLAESTICEAADLLRADIEPDDVAIDALVIDAIKRVQGERDALRARLATVEAAGRALIEAWDAEIAAYESEDDVDWGTRMGAAHLRRQQAQEAFRAALAATPAAGEPDGFEPSAPRLRFGSAAAVVEWLTRDDDRRDQQPAVCTEGHHVVAPGADGCGEKPHGADAVRRA